MNAPSDKPLETAPETEAVPAAPLAATIRIFLVCVDDTDEWRNALRFACGRAKHTKGRVALVRVIERGEFQHWGAVEKLIQEETRQEVEQQLQKTAKDVITLTGELPALYVREGSLREELTKLIDEEPSISVLVLGASPSSEGPGPLIQHFAGKRAGKMRIPITIVPGGLSPDEIDALS